MKVKIGTRGSALALAQTHLVKEALESLPHGVEVELIEVIKTLGDKKQGTAAASDSDKKDWVYDLELAILDGRIDFAQHSGKDIPSDIEPGTRLIPVLSRANPLDAFVGRPLESGQGRLSFAELPKGAKVGTASLRRRAQLLKYRPDLEVVEHRGNVPTRIQKLDESDDIMGIILACAGLERLGLQDLGYEQLSVQQMMPALSQGTLVLQYRENDDRLESVFKDLCEPKAYAAWRAERAVAEVLEGDCKSAISIFAEVKEQTVSLASQVMSPDGTQCIEVVDSAPIHEAHQLGLSVGKALLAKGAATILEEARHFKL